MCNRWVPNDCTFLVGLCERFCRFSEIDKKYILFRNDIFKFTRESSLCRVYFQVRHNFEIAREKWRGFQSRTVRKWLYFIVFVYLRMLCNLVRRKKVQQPIILRKTEFSSIREWWRSHKNFYSRLGTYVLYLHELFSHG